MLAWSSRSLRKPVELAFPSFSHLFIPSLSSHWVPSTCQAFLSGAGDKAVTGIDFVPALVEHIIQWMDTSVLVKGEHF